MKNYMMIAVSVVLTLGVVVWGVRSFVVPEKQGSKTVTMTKEECDATPNSVLWHSTTKQCIIKNF